MIHSVSKEMITVIQCVPRIAERITPATAAQLKVSCCPLHLSCLSTEHRHFLCFSIHALQYHINKGQLSLALKCTPSTCHECCN